MKTIEIIGLVLQAMAIVSTIQINIHRYDPCMPYKNPEDQRRAARAHYAANKEIYKARASANRKKQREAIKGLIRSAKSRPCTDCGIQYPSYVMHFDHKPGDEKLFNIGAVVRECLSLMRVAAEIEKCDVVCANCHAERTHQRGYDYSLQLPGDSAI